MKPFSHVSDSGPYAGRLRAVEITLVDGELLATPFMGRDMRLLVGESDTQFLSAEGLDYQFVKDQNGFVTHLVEIHVSGNYLTSGSADPRTPDR